MGLQELHLRHVTNSNIQNCTANSINTSQSACTVYLGHKVRSVRLDLPPVQHKHIARLRFREGWLIVIWGERDVSCETRKPLFTGQLNSWTTHNLVVASESNYQSAQQVY